MKLIYVILWSYENPSLHRWYFKKNLKVGIHRSYPPRSKGVFPMVRPLKSRHSRKRSNRILLGESGKRPYRLCHCEKRAKRATKLNPTKSLDCRAPRVARDIFESSRERRGEKEGFIENIISPSK